MTPVPGVTLAQMPRSAVRAAQLLFQPEPPRQAQERLGVSSIFGPHECDDRGVPARPSE